MSAYETLCDAFFEDVPRREKLDRIIRDLPKNVRDAVAEYLNVPSGLASMPTMIYNCDTAYVDLYKSIVDDEGARLWERCNYDRSLEYNSEGVLTFNIGVYMEETRNAVTNYFYMAYVSFCLDDYDENSVELRIQNLSNSLVIENAHDRASYAAPAKVAIDLLLNDLQNPKLGFGSRASIGFTKLRSQ